MFLRIVKMRTVNRFAMILPASIYLLGSHSLILKMTGLLSHAKMTTKILIISNVKLMRSLNLCKTTSTHLKFKLTMVRSAVFQMA